MGLVVLVCGGRRYADRARVFAELDALERARGPIDVVLDGHCRTWNGETHLWVDSGADRWAHEWAVDRGRVSRRFPADWKRFGPSAGPRRNHTMLEQKPDVVLAFPGGDGTKGMVALARRKLAATLQWPEVIEINDVPMEKRAS